MLDDRQYRSDNPCGDGESLRAPRPPGSYTMLGREQEEWVARGFARFGRALEHRRATTAARSS